VLRGAVLHASPFDLAEPHRERYARLVRDVSSTDDAETATLAFDALARWAPWSPDAPTVLATATTDLTQRTSWRAAANGLVAAATGSPRGEEGLLRALRELAEAEPTAEAADAGERHDHPAGRADEERAAAETSGPAAADAFGDPPVSGGAEERRGRRSRRAGGERVAAESPGLAAADAEDRRNGQARPVGGDRRAAERPGFAAADAFGDPPVSGDAEERPDRLGRPAGDEWPRRRAAAEPPGLAGRPASADAEERRDRPARRRVEYLVVRLAQHARVAAGPVRGAALAAGELLGEYDAFVPQAAEIAVFHLDLDAEPEQLDRLAVLTEGRPALAARTAGELGERLRRQAHEGDPEALLDVARRLAAHGGHGQGLLAAALTAAIGSRTGWAAPWREQLRALRRHPVADVRDAALDQVTAYE